MPLWPTPSKKNHLCKQKSGCWWFSDKLQADTSHRMRSEVSAELQFVEYDPAK